MSVVGESLKKKAAKFGEYQEVRKGVVDLPDSRALPENDWRIRTIQGHLVDAIGLPHSADVDELLPIRRPGRRFLSAKVGQPGCNLADGVILAQITFAVSRLI